MYIYIYVYVYIYIYIYTYTHYMYDIYFVNYNVQLQHLYKSIVSTSIISEHIVLV